MKALQSVKKYLRGASACSLVALLFPLLLTACKQEFYFPIASGRPYEVLVVMDKQDWNAPHGRALHKVLDTDVPGLPQSEPSFHISQCNEGSFDNTLNLFRNIILVKIDKTLYTKTKMKFTRNKWAMNQIVLTIQSPSKQEFADFCQRNSQQLVDFFTRTEMNRLVGELKDKHSDVVEKLAKELFGCTIYAPSELKSSKRGQDFFWTSNNTASGMVNLCMYSYPYEGPETFTKEYVLAKRDSVMKANIPGSNPPMDMKAETAYTSVRPIWVHQAYAMEARGLWYVENDGMGGPFVSQSRVDTISKRVIVTEGFVYAPEKMKRGLMRRMEGSLYSVLLPQEQDAEIDTGVDEEKSGNENLKEGIQTKE